MPSQEQVTMYARSDERSPGLPGGRRILILTISRMFQSAPFILTFFLANYPLQFTLIFIPVLVVVLGLANSLSQKSYDRHARGIDAPDARSYFIRNAPMTIVLVISAILLILSVHFIDQYLVKYSGSLNFLAFLLILFLTTFMLSPVQSLFADRMAEIDPVLTERFGNFASQLGVRNIRIFSVPWKPYRIANAFQVGPALSYSVYVTDFLIEGLKRDELDFVILHELFHAKRKHILKTLLPTMGILFLLGSMKQVPFGLIGNDVLIIVAVIGYLYGLIISLPLVMTFIMRRNETEADTLAVNFTKNYSAAESSLRRLEELNFNPALKRRSRFLQTHPPIDERIERIRELGERAGKRQEVD